MLYDLTGLNSLTSVGGILYIWQNNTLTSLNGLDNLNYIGGGMSIGYSYTSESGNPALTNISSLYSLQTVIGEINISYNNSLTSLSGLDNIDAGSVSSLRIWSNESLSECDVQGVCEYIADPGGFLLIGLNAMGCYYLPQVQEACLTRVNEFSGGEEIGLFPNPTSTFITITTPQGQFVEVVIIYNHLGQKVLTEKPVNNNIDISGMQPGIYILEVVTKTERYMTKLIRN